MRIESNIAGVIRQTQRLIQNIPVAMERALEPARWEPVAYMTAQRVLLALAEPKERVYIQGFLDTVKAGVLQGKVVGLSLRMREPFGHLMNVLENARRAGAVVSPKDMGLGLFEGQVTELEDLILKWVETPEADGGKKRDARDLGKTDEEIASLITYIMTSPTLGKKGQQARARLMPHIAQFVAQSQAVRLSPETVDLWLRAVLKAWREMMRLHYPGLVRQILLGMKSEL